MCGLKVKFQEIDSLLLKDIIEFVIVIIISVESKSWYHIKEDIVLDFVRLWYSHLSWIFKFLDLAKSLILFIFLHYQVNKIKIYYIQEIKLLETQIKWIFFNCCFISWKISSFARYLGLGKKDEKLHRAILHKFYREKENSGKKIYKMLDIR